jgi:dTDP-4-dehydrorhamnose reductase
MNPDTSRGTRFAETGARAEVIEMWGGVESTCNRVGNRYSDQVVLSGHQDRLEDLDRFAALGIRALRYPILWERTSPQSPSCDWAWADRRMERLRSLGVRPIIGLVHHGSGPPHTNLLDPGFAEGLAEFAGSVARRYPWVVDFTPVNEPISTARFSALYGHWYPHANSTSSFVRAVLVQCRAIVRSMEEIRRVTPRARLVHTEDAGRSFGTPLLDPQIRYENRRRDLAMDLLMGRVDVEHPFYREIRGAGASSAELSWFREHPCPPDVLGINYYVTSDRFLDERTSAYPESTRGGNAFHRYCDVEAVRASRCQAPLVGFREVLLSAWKRYRVPVAITEAHLGGTREEQLRWLAEAWVGAHEARAAGADVRAVTAWALLGSYDWDSLVVREDGHYEPGAYDVRSDPPRPTAVARMICDLARRGRHESPVLASPGWWRRPDRLVFPPVEAPAAARPLRAAIPDGEPVPSDPPIVITGAGGTLGRAFTRLCKLRGLPTVRANRSDLDVADPVSVDRFLDRTRPWAVVNAAGYVRVDEAESDVDRCRRENTRGAEVLASACAVRAIRLLTFSSDLVFAGEQTTPYVETDETRPLAVYGSSKAEAERLVADIDPDALIVRTSAFFGPWDEHNFVTRTLSELSAGRPVFAAADVVVSPTYVPDLVHASLNLLIDGERGIWHLAGDGALSWADFARASARLAGLDAELVRPRTASSLGWIAARPKYSALGSERGTLMPETLVSVARYLSDVAAVGAAGKTADRFTGTYD